MVRLRFALVVLVVALAACSGAMGRDPVSSLPATGAHAAPSLIVHIPRRVKAGKGRGVRFVSPSTQSASIAIAPTAGCTACSPSFSINPGLTPSSPNCNASTSGTDCTIVLPLDPGTYTGTLSTYDGAPGCQASSACATLSANEAFPLNVARGKANQIAVTLYGLPKKLIAIASTKNTTIFDAFVYVGGINATSLLSLYATDADGNLILGPGAPTFSLPAQPANGWTASLKGNLLTFVTPAAFHPTGATAPFEVDLKGSGCALAGAKCTFDLYPNVDPQIAITDGAGNAVYVLFTNSVTGDLTQYAKITSGISDPIDAKFDVDGNLIVANQGNDSIAVFAPPYASAPVATIHTAVEPVGLAVDGDGKIAVSESFFATSNVTIYYPPSSALTKTIGLSSAAAPPAFSWVDDALWVATSGHVQRFASPYNGAATPDLAIANPTAIDLDRNANLFVADSVAGTVTKYAAGAYSAGPSIPSLNAPTSLEVAYNDLAVCTKDGGALYTGAFLVASSYLTGTASPCFIAADFTLSNVWIVTQVAPGEAAIVGPNTFGYKGLTPNSIDAFPSPKIYY
jgi:hypothetical protein